MKDQKCGMCWCSLFLNIQESRKDVSVKKKEWWLSREPDQTTLGATGTPSMVHETQNFYYLAISLLPLKYTTILQSARCETTHFYHKGTCGCSCHICVVISSSKSNFIVKAKFSELIKGKGLMLKCVTVNVSQEKWLKMYIWLFMLNRWTARCALLSAAHVDLCWVAASCQSLLYLISWDTDKTC